MCAQILLWPGTDGQRQQAHAQKGAAQEQEGDHIASSAIFDDANQRGSNEPAQIPDGIDEGDASCRCCSAQVRLFPEPKMGQGLT